MTPPLHRDGPSHTETQIWRNLEKDPATLTAHRITGQILRLIITVVNSLPLLFITVLANLDALTRRWPRLQTLRDSSKFWEAVFTAAAGILPAGLAALFVLALPHLMRLLSHWQGALSRGQMDQDVIKQMFVFMLVSTIYGLLGSWLGLRRCRLIVQSLRCTKMT